MSGANPKFERGPLTYEVSGNVKGGKLVAIDGSTKKVKQNDAANGRVLGVALTDAQAASSDPASVDAFGNNGYNISLHPPYTAVAMTGVHRLLNSGAALAWGDYVVADAAGGVAKATASTAQAAVVVGRVVNVDGAATGAKADVLLIVQPAPPA